MAEWSKATLVKNERVAPALHRLWLRVEDDVAKAFQVAGQYHRVRAADSTDAPFAIASAPGGLEFEYLVRGMGGLSDRFIAAGVGAQFEVTMPKGPGFPIARAHGRPLLFIGTGTGFAPLRSAILEVVRQRQHFTSVHVLYGVHDDTQLVYSDEFEAWGLAKITVLPTVSRASEGWRGEVGYVQHLLAKIPVEGAVACLCGQPAMIDEVRGVLSARGVAVADMLLNW